MKAVGHPTPYIGEILDAAFSCAHAVVVLFTPDDIARLQEQFRSERDPRHEVEATGQARPNVLFEAGMAMGRDSNRTILVEMGKLRPFSDIAGRHIIRLDGSSKQRQQLAQRLRAAGCPVNLDGTDWHTEGNFDEALKVANSSWESAVAVDDPQLATAARSLLEEAARDDDRMIRIIRTAGGQTIRNPSCCSSSVPRPSARASMSARTKRSSMRQRPEVRFATYGRQNHYCSQRPARTANRSSERVGHGTVEYRNCEIFRTGGDSSR